MTEDSKGAGVAGPSLPDHPTAEEQAGCRIVEGWKGHGVAETKIKPCHLNAQGHVMGGAVFTLADYAFAAAAMCGQAAAVSLSSTIEFMRSTQGTKLIATCDVVTDDAGELIAKFVTSCYHPIVVGGDNDR